MNYYYFSPPDLRKHVWILFHYVGQRLELRPRYSSYACARCGKVDEYGALDSGIAEEVSVDVPRDMFVTDDGFVCVSNRAKEAMMQRGVTGLDFLQVPRAGFSIAVPTCMAKVDDPRRFLKQRDPCVACKRFREATGLVPLWAVKMPDDPMVIVKPDVRFEGNKAQECWVLVSDAVIEVLEAANLKGLGFYGPALKTPPPNSTS